MMLPDKYFAWVDLETTGSTPGQHEILELGFILTDVELAEIDRAVWLVEPESVRRTGELFIPSEYVTRMHTENGLIADLKKYRGQLTWAVDDELVNILNRHGVKTKRDVMLAGSGVSHFDRAFLKLHMPRFEAMLAYPSMDVGVIRRYYALRGENLVPDAGSDNRNHRALDDVVHHLNELRSYVNRDGREAFSRRAPKGS